ncbi:MAG TPA: maleylpyruvate isomerase N-terminal domain-containing protein [Amycolatopsis sp.]|uniref:maleylpyruvate isomerase N-terminal domain-containing protein n=1 Tax=Amycolatopsis sp. TaxID=37632 RepID=UPI002B486FAE|nr:maleylpyruvate isomerase N-terminal domain-containing protein [Amycolatopsis sp.]HKS47600.1 maleylpyruvate isomerase N-terminal domain-containing protein [Amycolatopsis sp.]
MSSFDDFDRATATVTKIIEAVEPGQPGLPTACAEWDVRAVGNHLVQGNLKTVAWAGSGPPPEEGDRLARTSVPSSPTPSSRPAPP